MHRGTIIFVAIPRGDGLGLRSHDLSTALWNLVAAAGLWLRWVFWAFWASNGLPPLWNGLWFRWNGLWPRPSAPPAFTPLMPPPPADAATPSFACAEPLFDIGKLPRGEKPAHVPLPNCLSIDPSRSGGRPALLAPKDEEAWKFPARENASFRWRSTSADFRKFSNRASLPLRHAFASRTITFVWKRCCWMSWGAG